MFYCIMKKTLIALLIISIVQFQFLVARKVLLNKNWTLKNESISITNIEIPSGVFTELEKHRYTESILYSKNDVELRWIGETEWTYELTFASPTDLENYTNALLTFNGLDTVTTIKLNGQTLGTTDNMFVRYTFDVKGLLRAENENNLLQVYFQSPIAEALRLADQQNPIPPECPNERYNGICHMNMLRKMQASFSWDWGPAVPSVGIWKSVEMELTNSAIIRDVLINLQLHSEIWHLDVWILFESIRNDTEGVLSVEILGLEHVSAQKTIKIPRNAETQQHLHLQIHEDDVLKWWPNGMGSQNLYTMHVRYEDSESNEVGLPHSDVHLRSDRLLRVGFRTVEIIEDPAIHGTSFYFKVNGLPVFMKGSNFIPASIFPELSADETTIRRLLDDAKDAHMNMLRVWGGGIYESDLFYDLADEKGILIWQDMMFACAMYPSKDDFLDSVRLETKQNVRRIQSHPSIAIWATNNENEAALRQNWYGTNSNFGKFAKEYQELYIDTVKDEILKNDPWRIVLNSSPGNGIKQENITIADNPQDYHFGDIHFYTYDLNLWDPRIYPRSRFVSEYGFQSFPSYSSWNSIKRPEENLENLIDHRQHFPFGSTPIDILIEKNLPQLDHTAEDYVQSWIYFSQVSQAMAVKTQTNVYRVEVANKNSMQTAGALYWQLNDVWTAPSWSGIEFSGKYKILQYYIKEIFQPDVVVGLMNKLQNFDVYVINEHLKEKNYILLLRLYRFGSLDVLDERKVNVTMKPNSVQLIETYDFYKELQEKGLDYREHIVQLLLKSEDNVDTLSVDWLLFSTINEVRKIQPSEIQLKVAHYSCTMGLAVASISIEIAKPALFVFLEADRPEIILPKFSSNGFHQFNAAKLVHLTYQNPNCSFEVKTPDLKVTVMNQFMLR